jgi:hypothetical protein
VAPAALEAGTLPDKGQEPVPHSVHLDCWREFKKRQRMGNTTAG